MKLIPKQIADRNSAVAVEARERGAKTFFLDEFSDPDGQGVMKLTGTKPNGEPYIGYFPADQWFDPEPDSE
ncbi:hypothetical protein [Primorskyibacter sp. S87]|uniref:hypothetical protein n=1 Tax=Primorskyibacter sp. S87 TaxID=3415126 RepID=UPI003C7C6460